MLQRIAAASTALLATALAFAAPADAGARSALTVRSVHIGSSASSIAFGIDDFVAGHVFVLEPATHQIAVLPQPAAAHPARVLRRVRVAAGATALTFLFDGQAAFNAEPHSQRLAVLAPGRVTIYDAVSWQVLARVPVCEHPVAMDGQTPHLFVACAGGTVDDIRPNAAAVIRSWHVTGRPVSLTTPRQGGSVYIGCRNGLVTEIEIHASHGSAPVRTRVAAGVTGISTAAKRIWVANGRTGTLTAVSVATAPAVLSTTTVAPHLAAVTAGQGGRSVFALRRWAHSLAVFSTENLAVTRTVRLPRGVRVVAATPYFSRFVYAAGAGTVSVVRLPGYSPVPLG